MTDLKLKPFDKFKKWVEDYQIGPSMNDRYLANYYKRECPKLYSGIDGSVGDGWIPIIERLATDLISMGWDRDLHQVKEKFGGLRFYIGPSTAEMQERIADAEEESLRTCEDCGAPGTTSTGPTNKYWILTLCDECRAKGRR